MPLMGLVKSSLLRAFGNSHLPRRKRSTDGSAVRTTEADVDIGGSRIAFVAGLHRSGTSIVHRKIREHRDVSGFVDTGVPEDEGQFLQTVFPAAKEYGGPGRFAFHPGAHLTETDAVRLDPESGRLLLRQWGAHWDLSRQILLEKSPPTIIRSRFFQAMFPDSRFVFIVRHPVPVAYATRKWSATTLSELLCHWTFAHAILAGDLEYVSKSMVVRYEDFVADPDQTLQRIHEFLDLRSILSSEKVSDRNGKYFDQWDNKDDRQEIIEEIIGGDSSVMARFGYYLHEPYVGAPPPGSVCSPARS